MLILTVLSVGILQSQELYFPDLDTLTIQRNLLGLHESLKKIDTTDLKPREKAAYYYYSGSVLYFEDNNEGAIEYLLRSKSILNEFSEDERFVFNLNDRLLEGIGSTTEYSVRPQELIEENCRIAYNLNDPTFLYNCYYYQYADALDNKKYEQALNLMNQAMEVVSNGSSPNLVANLQSNIGHTHLNLRNLDSVLPNYQKAEKYYLLVNDESKLAYLYNNYGNYYKIIGDFERALDYLLKAYDYRLDQEEASTKNFILKNIADTYYFNGEFEKAALAYETFAKKSDSLDRADHAKKIQYYNTKYQTAEKEKQILVETQKKNQNKNIALALGGGLLAVSIFGFLIYKNTKRKQRIAEQERELEIQKKEKILKEQELNAIDAMIEGQEKERQRLASDLHDSVGATLSAAKLQFDHLAKNKDKLTSLEELFEKTGNLLDEAYTEVRSMAHLKNSGVIAKKGLLPAVEKLAKNASTQQGLKIEVQDFGLTEKLEASLEISIFRIIQELVTNIIKHAHASEANISITQHEDTLSIIVEDDGRGFDPRAMHDSEGMGLGSIEKRVEHLEGTMEVDSTPGKGTNILIDIPI